MKLLQLDTKTSLDIVNREIGVSGNELQLDTKTSLDIVPPMAMMTIKQLQLDTKTSLDIVLSRTTCYWIIVAA